MPLRTSVIALVLLLVSPRSAFAALLTVGPPGTAGSCSYTTIQAALNVAGTTPGADEIRVVDSGEYANQALLLYAAGSVRIIGGYPDCNALSVPQTRSRLSGNGALATPVLTIAHSCDDPIDVKLERLEFVDGANPNGSGGGISIEACGRVTLTNSRVADNSALSGAGIYFNGDEGASGSTLVIGDGVSIDHNTATLYGGGIYVEHGRLEIGGNQTAVRVNRALAGGGLAVRGDNGAPGELSIRSGGIDLDGVVSHNSASYGGALYVGSYGGAEIYTTDPARPVRLDHNFASLNGGGLFVTGASSYAWLWDAVVESNIAMSGGGAFDVENGRVSMESSRSNPYAPEDAVPCSSSRACNLLRDNSVSSSPGAVARLVYYDPSLPTSLYLGNVRISANRGDSLFADDCSTGFFNCSTPVRLDITNSQITENPGVERILRTSLGMDFACYNCTFSRNGNSEMPMFDSTARGSLTLINSIIWEPGRDVIGGAMPPALTSHDMLIHDNSDFTSGSDIVTQNPLFIDPSTGDFHLSENSPGIDRASASGASSIDLDGKPRLIDVASIPNHNGPLDLGAFERQVFCADDLIFCSGFEQ